VEEHAIEPRPRFEKAAMFIESGASVANAPWPGIATSPGWEKGPELLGRPALLANPPRPAMVLWGALRVPNWNDWNALPELLNSVIDMLWSLLCGIIGSEKACEMLRLRRGSG
jgi:hypothetical protein